MGVAVVAVVVGVRLVWLLPAGWLAKKLHRRRDSRLDVRSLRRP